MSTGRITRQRSWEVYRSVPERCECGATEERCDATDEYECWALG